MDKCSIIVSASLALFFAATTSAQSERTPLDDYLDNAKTIFIGKCISTEAPNILLISHIELEVVQMIKGDEKIAKIGVDVRYGMKVGKYYLVRMPKPEFAKPQKTMSDEPGGVIPVSEREDFALLKTLEPRIIVVRTMNHRIDDLESTIRRSTWELEALRSVKKGN